MGMKDEYQFGTRISRITRGDTDFLKKSVRVRAIRVIRVQKGFISVVLPILALLYPACDSPFFRSSLSR